MAELDPDALCAFVEAAIRQFDPDERAQFFTRLSETLNQYDDAIGNANGGDQYSAAPRPTMSLNQQARAMRRNGNGNGDGGRQSRAAMDSHGAFLQRFPMAAKIRVMG